MSRRESLYVHRAAGILPRDTMLWRAAGVALTLPGGIRSPLARPGADDDDDDAT